MIITKESAPHIRRKANVTRMMADVLIALAPTLIFAFVVYPVQAAINLTLSLFIMNACEFIFVGLKNMMPADGLKHTFKERFEHSYKGKFTQNLSFSGNIRPAKGWNFGFSASYNFDTHRLAYMNCNISRDMHCFTMRASFVPVGPYKSYNFHIAVKSSILQDLKYDKRSSLSNGVTWY